MSWLHVAVVLGAGLLSCTSAGPSGRRTSAVTDTAAPTSRPSAQHAFVRVEQASEVACPGAAVRADGSLVCLDEARTKGLTILDLQDGWTPRLFAAQPDGTAPAFRASYLAIAAGVDADGAPRAAKDALEELYGVLPAMSIVRARLADDARHACHEAIDPAPILALPRPYAQDHKDVVRASDRRRVVLEKRLDKLRVKRGLPDLTALGADVADEPAHARAYAQWKTASELHAGILAAQRKLVCEGFLDPKHADGGMHWQSSDAANLWQRQNFLMPNERLDEETRAAMQLPSRELDFRLALRVLRERVVDATGLIEDGTAGAGPQPILGRMLDPAPMRAARGRTTPLSEGAPDLISAATEAAARELGWTDAAAVRAFLTRHPQGVRVALALPPVPAYHRSHMALSAVIDRGDVWYDDRPITRTITQRPTLVVSVDDGGVKRPLIRWPTTIGGWSDVTMGGRVVRRWKESDVGPRVWRELVAAPTWLPPASTPDRDLVKNNWNGTWSLKSTIMGPGPHAAFGLMILRHDHAETRKDGTVHYWNNGIGSHGSASVTSIVNGTSHGCHRLYNQLALRLGNFLLLHRDHTVRGEEKTAYRRRVRHKGSFLAKIDTRGFYYELTPPVPVMVTKGNIQTARKVPPRASAPAE